MSEERWLQVKTRTPHLGCGERKRGKAWERLGKALGKALGKGLPICFLPNIVLIPTCGYKTFWVEKLFTTRMVWRG